MKLPGHTLAFGSRQHFALPITANFHTGVKAREHWIPRVSSAWRCPGPSTISDALAVLGHVPGFAAAVASRGSRLLFGGTAWPADTPSPPLIPCRSCAASARRRSRAAEVARPAEPSGLADTPQTPGYSDHPRHGPQIAD